MTLMNNEIHKDDVYARIGMALVSIQRVERACKYLIICLKIADKKTKFFSSEEFLERSNLDKLDRYTLGSLFRLLNLNRNIGLEKEFSAYLRLRNSFVHSFSTEYLTGHSELQKMRAIDACFEIGRLSQKMERYIRGITYYFAFSCIKDHSKIDSSVFGGKEDYELYLRDRLTNIET